LLYLLWVGTSGEGGVLLVLMGIVAVSHGRSLVRVDLTVGLLLAKDSVHRIS